MSKTLTLAHSPEADDAFMFYALATGKVETGDLEFEHQLEDIEALNLRAVNGEVDISAISIHAYGKVWDEYVLLPHGFAVGEGYGPRVVAREPMDTGDLRGCVVAVPGQLTSAHLALRLFEHDVEVRFVRFDEVMSYVGDGFADAGVIIYEGELTYPEAGLRLVLDLGQWWQGKTGLPLPLGGRVARRSLGDETIARVCRCMQESIQYALDHRREALEYASGFVGEMPGERVDEFVGMYVNARTLDLGDDGREAVREFLVRGFRAGFIDRVPDSLFFGH
ncbi:MAG: ABC transporter substrate-binding protein [Gemmatimonadota bacterium]|nr:MAG: ABC transporter substrate-binding protein [Gemmatimonadota bacterium]